jgi:Flp pilus assembly protein TadD
MHRTDIRRLFDQALAHHGAGRLHDAEQIYRKILARNPRHAPALQHLGVIAHQAGHHDAAAKLIEEALAIFPDYAEAQSNLALVLLALGRRQEAIERLRQAIKLRPDYAQAHYNLGLAQDLAGDFAASIPCYDAAIRLKPDYADAHCNLGNALHCLDLYENAAASYRRALELAPHLTRLHTYLGLALIGESAVVEAIEAYRQGIAAVADDPVTHFCLAEALIANSDLSGALRSFEDALRRIAARGALSAPERSAPGYGYPVAHYPDAMRAVVRRLDDAGIEVFLTGGTLLGAMREGDFLGFDKDLDFGIWSDVTPFNLWCALAPDPDFKLSWEPGVDGPLVAYGWRNKIAIDFFRFTREPERVSCALYYSGTLMRWLHRPFRLVDFNWHGVRVKVPDDSDRFLTEVYGEWRTPNPHFGMFASPNIEGGFPPISRSIAYSAIFLALWRRQREKAKSLCDQVLALDPGNGLILDLRKGLGAAPSTAQITHSPAESAILQEIGRAFDAMPG